MQRHLALRRGALLLVLLSLLVGAFSAPTPSAQAQSVDIKVNFQPGPPPNNPQMSVVPEGYLRDFGQPYDQRSAADQGNGQYSFGWVEPGTQNPRSLEGNARNRSASAGGVDIRYRTFIHMQANTTAITPGVLLEGAWEMAVPNGKYEVTVAVGDPQEGCGSGTRDKHTIYVESSEIISNYVSVGGIAAPTCNKTQSAVVTVNDNRLTVRATNPNNPSQGGFNTKINFVEILSTNSNKVRPRVADVTPRAGATGVRRDTGVVATVIVPNGGINGATLTSQSVKLINTVSGQQVPVVANTSGGGDVITLSPVGFLEANTSYRFEVNEGLLDAAGESFRPFSSTFTTGELGGPSGGNSTIAFRQTKNLAALPTGTLLSSLSIGPDGKLYAASLTGEIFRYPINADGTLGAPETLSAIRNAEGRRAIIGLAWDPAATAENLVLWVSHNGEYVQQDAPDWTGKIARLSGPNLENVQNLVVNLPHSFKDHMNNSLAFGPNGLLYMPMASNTAMGAVDLAWGSRPERLLTATILEIDTQALLQSGTTLDVKTEEGGSYNPFAPGAPVRIYATGVRNAYDLVWHSNGQLYAAANGSAAGGNMPAMPSTIELASRPECQSRIDGQPYSYNGPSPILSVSAAPDQQDYMFRVEKGGYYGHPNPLRCEWIAYGGNPTSGVDPEEQAPAAGRPGYPEGVLPDPNYRGIVYNFDVHISPNGSIEYQSDTFSGTLKGKLIIARYSLGDDLIVLDPGADGKTFSDMRGLPGMGGLNNPLDLIENTANGDLYVIEHGPPSQISLLRPLAANQPQIEATPASLLESAMAGGPPGREVEVTVKNTGTGTLGINGVTIAGPHASDFELVPPALPVVLEPGNATVVKLRFGPQNAGLKTATLRVTNANGAPTLEVPLRGLAAPAGGEPSLKSILDLYQYEVNVGDDDPETAVIRTSADEQRQALLGNEIDVQRFVRADNANPVIVEPLAVYGPTANNPVVGFGWYQDGASPAPTTTSITPTELFRVANTPSSNGQTVNPVLNAGASTLFDPGNATFGLFASTGQGEGARTVYSQDVLNSFANAVPHQMRVYRLRDVSGSPVENSFVLGIELGTESLAYQDLVLVLRNVKPAEPIPVDVDPDLLERYLPIVAR
jgi:glucose/arabinose dehydrogenase